MGETQDCSRIPSLVLLCQRVAGNHADSISSLGHMSLDLVRPILEKCSVDQLLRLEEASPHLQSGTPDIWKYLCFRKYRMIAEEHYSRGDEPQEPDSWKHRFFSLQEVEAKRFQEIGSRIRSQRMEAEERKREREVKFTDRVPLPKRARTSGGWGVSVQPKTLFQKARGEASKIQRALYNTRLLPPMPTGKTQRVLAKPDDLILPPLPSSMPSRVVVNTVTLQRRIRPPPSSSTSNSNGTTSSSSNSSGRTTPAHSPPASSIPKGLIQDRVDFPQSNSARTSGPSEEITKVPPKPPAVPLSAPPSRPVKSPGTLKKDPLASLFVPKHRAYSQRPVR